MTHTVGQAVFSPKDPSEIVIVTFDFAELTAAVLTPTVSATWKRGSEDLAPALLSGNASISGAKVLQKVQGGVAGADYLLRCQVDTADAQRYVLTGTLPVRTA